MKLLTQAGIWMAFAQLALTAPATGEQHMAAEVPENLYRGELVTFPGPWAFTIGRAHIILVSDEQLEQLADPDKVLNLSLTHEPREESLRQICERAQAAGQRTLIIAFDHFFAQYRSGQEGKPRRLTPDKDEYVERIAAISQFAEQYGLGLELSLLSPLEIGPAYAAETRESGTWMHYRKGLRDPKSGAYSVQFWRHKRWANNKGPLELEDAGVRVFAFREQAIGGTPYRVVDPKDIVEISDTAQSEVWEHTIRRAGDFEAVRVRVHGSGRTDVGELDKVLIVQQYRTPEMDYFSEKALPFLTQLIDKYADAGVKLNGLYADEMHIQQDWAYFNHHDHGEFALRYVSDGLAKRFAETYGEEYGDFAKYLVYFVHGQDDFVHDLSAKEGVMHVMDNTPEAVQAAALLRSRYYRMLQDGVVGLFTAAKRHAETRMGHRLESRAHATWAESPTIDHWNVGRESRFRNSYEYTSNFVWSDTVHQAAAACHDYFKWGDFLTGNGNDHAEGGWLDRNYYGLALGCSTGIINEVPYSYAAHWGMPAEISRRRTALVNTYGAAAQPFYGMVQGVEHRDVEVLMLYPLDLVAAEERFGSWMTQYGYANYITQAKLLELGKVSNGAIELAGRRFTTLVALFEPFPAFEVLTMMQQLAESGGRVIWSGPPPLLMSEPSSGADTSGLSDASEVWEALTGVQYAPAPDFGIRTPGKRVEFEGDLADVAPMTVLTDFLVDRVYPVTPMGGDERIAARVKDMIVGSHRHLGAGSVTYLGFRPRDDQSGSLGYESRHWFDILNTLGAYPATGEFPGVNDNTEYVSRTSQYLTCRFPNGAVAIAPHLHALEEGWPGGFARDAEEDKKIVADLDLPSDRLELREFKVNGHSVTYDGEHAVTFRVTGPGHLAAFCGAGCAQITIDDRTTVFAERRMALVAWAPVEETRRPVKETGRPDERAAAHEGCVLQARVHGTGVVRIPAQGLPENVRIFAEGATPGSRGEEVPSRIEEGALAVVIEPGVSGRWLYVVRAPAAGE